MNAERDHWRTDHRCVGAALASRHCRQDARSATSPWPIGWQHGARLRAGMPLETLIEEMDANGIATAMCSAGPLIPNEDVSRRCAATPIG